MKLFRSTCCKSPVATRRTVDMKTLYYICVECGEPCQAEWMEAEVGESNVGSSTCCNAGVHVVYHKYGGKRWHCDKCGNPCEVVI